MILATCSACGWVHMAYTEAEAQTEVDRFNAYFDAASPEIQALYGSTRSRLQDYQRCLRCGAAGAQMRPYKPGDCPDGVTIGPVITTC